MYNLVLADQSRVPQSVDILDGIDVRESTRADYKSRLPAFFEFMGSRPLTVTTFLEYKRELGSRTDISVATKNKYLAPAAVFLQELHRRGYLPMDITTNVHYFQQSKRGRPLPLSHGFSSSPATRYSSSLSCSSSSPDIRSNRNGFSVVERFG